MNFSPCQSLDGAWTLLVHSTAMSLGARWSFTMVLSLVLLRYVRHSPNRDSVVILLPIEMAVDDTQRAKPGLAAGRQDGRNVLCHTLYSHSILRLRRTVHLKPQAIWPGACLISARTLNDAVCDSPVDISWKMTLRIRAHLCGLAR